VHWPSDDSWQGFMRLLTRSHVFASAQEPVKILELCKPIPRKTHFSGASGFNPPVSFRAQNYKLRSFANGHGKAYASAGKRIASMMHHPTQVWPSADSRRVFPSLRPLHDQLDKAARGVDPVWGSTEWRPNIAPPGDALRQTRGKIVTSGHNDVSCAE
jgi:hypothetical protein